MRRLSETGLSESFSLIWTCLCFSGGGGGLRRFVCSFPPAAVAMHCSTRQERCCCRPWTAEQPPQPPERPQRPSRPHRQSTLPSTPLVPGHELQCWPRWPLAAIHRVRADDRTAGCLDRWRWTRLAPFRLGRNRLQHRTEHELRVITGYHFVSPTIHRDRNAARITRCPCRRRMRAQAVARRPSTYMFRQSRCEAS